MISRREALVGEGPMVVRLPSGLRIRLREPRPDGAEVYLRAIQALSPQSRRRRFFTDRADYTVEEIEPFVRCDGVREIGRVAVELDERDEEVEAIGIGHVIRPTEVAPVGEVSVVVCDDRHGQGVGTAIVRSLASASLSLGVERWEATCSTDNPPVLAILGKVGVIHDLTCSSGVYEFVVDLDERGIGAQAEGRPPAG